MAEEPRIVEVKGLAEALSDKEILVDLQIRMAEIGKDMINMAACFQEMSATFNEFMKATDQRIRHIETNCNREERWKNSFDTDARLHAKIAELDGRMTAIERAKCPRAGMFDDHDERLKILEDTHMQEAGWKKGVAPYIQFIVAGVLVVQSVIITFALYHMGIHG